jgi:AcrR family transcriptional regulator
LSCSGCISRRQRREITIQNVLDRADVGRSTFYSHFRNKDDLLQRDWEQFLAGLARHIDWDKATKGRFLPVVLLFSHVQDFQPFHKGLVRSRKADELFRSGVAFLSKEIEGALALRLGALAITMTCLNAHHLVAAALKFVLYLLDRHLVASLLHGVSNSADMRRRHAAKSEQRECSDRPRNTTQLKNCRVMKRLIQMAAVQEQ